MQLHPLKKMRACLTVATFICMSAVPIVGCGSLDPEDASSELAGTSSLGSAQASNLGNRTEDNLSQWLGECTANHDCPTAGIESACQKVMCIAGRCELVTSADHTPCDDYDACTEGTVCESGQCGDGRVIGCGDGNPCTLDSCDPLTGCDYAPSAEGLTCDDQDPCTFEDACVLLTCTGRRDGRCVCDTTADCVAFEDDNFCNGTLACMGGHCMLDQETIISCPLSGVCQASACSPLTGHCLTHLQPNGTGCDDGNPCTEDDRCSEGSCHGESGSCPCDEDGDCTIFQQDHYDLCQGPLTCLDGVCLPNPDQAVVCKDLENPENSQSSCLTTACDALTGLCVTVAEADGIPCATTNPCAPEGVCDWGICVTAEQACDDGQPCTIDVCMDGFGCVHEPRTGACDDLDACTGGETCENGECLGGTGVICDDLNPCTQDYCAVAAGGCASEVLDDGVSCITNDACLTEGVCIEGQCAEQMPVTCPDLGPCFSSNCVPGEGCVAKLLTDGSPCEDGNICNQPGTCESGECKTLPLPCNDGNPCTVDACESDPENGDGGCMHVPVKNGNVCEPDNPCLLAGTCVSGLCESGPPVDCASLPCMTQSCDPLTGACTPQDMLADASPCIPNNLCASTGFCTAGTCVDAEYKDCDDIDLCTLDACNPDNGQCIHIPMTCLPLSDDPCVDTTCLPSLGCISEQTDGCTEETLAWTTEFPCEEATYWSYLEETAIPAFSIDAAAPAEGPVSGECTLHLFVTEESVAKEDPWTTSTLSPAFDVQPLTLPAVLVIAFWEWWSWDTNPDAPEPDRRIQLMDGDGEFFASASLPKHSVSDSSTSGMWTRTEVSFDLSSAQSHRIAFTTTCTPSDGTKGGEWFIDQLAIWWEPLEEE
jgi:hypothetical protein